MTIGQEARNAQPEDEPVGDNTNMAANKSKQSESNLN